MQIAEKPAVLQNTGWSLFVNEQVVEAGRLATVFVTGFALPLTYRGITKLPGEGDKAWGNILLEGAWGVWTDLPAWAVGGELRRDCEPTSTETETLPLEFPVGICPVLALKFHADKHLYCAALDVCFEGGSPWLLWVNHIDSMVFMVYSLDGEELASAWDYMPEGDGEMEEMSQYACKVGRYEMGEMWRSREGWGPWFDKLYEPKEGEL